ncbi:MAG: oxidative damage protection protein [Sandaracinaceae bacterium]|nr:oxidative damage protection protein [Sandaracinaceae bacterium]
MARMVQCVKLGREAEGLDRPPFRNALGERLFQNISKEAWKTWIAHSTMLINENRWDMLNQQHAQKLLAECEKFFFGEGSAMPEGYVAPVAGAQAQVAPPADEKK